MSKQAKKALCGAWEGIALAAPLVIGCGLFYGVPFGMVLQNSFQRGTGSARQYVGLETYQNMLRSGVFRLALGNTVRFLAVALPLNILLAYAIALGLKSHAKRHEILKSVLLLPYMMPVAGTVLLVELLFAQTGLFNKALAAFGLPVADWLHSGAAFWVVVALYLWKNTGYSVILLLSGLITIPEEQYAAASLDGATAWQQFRHITSPQMWYSVFFATVFSLLNAFKCFREIFLIGGTHPDKSIYMLQHFVNNAFDKMNEPKLAVASVLLSAVLIVLFVLGYRWVLRKEAYKNA